MTKPTPYDVFEKAIAEGIAATVHDCWINFSCWEMARQYVDDPSHPAKTAIEWIYAMEDLRAGLEDFEGDGKGQCILALDQAYEAFAKISHSPDLIDAIQKWIEWRRNEECEAGV